MDFIQALRHHGLPVSPTETLDALNATRVIGVGNRQRLKTALSLTLAKTLIHRGQLETLFDQFFSPADTAFDPVHEFDNSDVTEETSSDTTAAAGATTEKHGGPFESPLAQQLFGNQTTALHSAMVQAAEQAGAQEMKLFLQKNIVSTRILMQMGDRELQRELLEFQALEQHMDLVAQLQQKRQQLVDRVKDYVEQQYLLYSAKSSELLAMDTLHRIKLSHVDHIQQQRIKKLVEKIAKKLASLYSRRRKVSKRGLLDVRKTIAANAAFDGYLIHTRWKSTRIERPRLMVICDVSGSVSAVAQFLLLFVYSLQEVLPKVRSFVFSNQLAEVTNCFRDADLETALSLIMDRWANHPTDYGRALIDFSELALKDIDHKTQIIMLGDARNNYNDGRADILRTICNRAQRVLWLNPEHRSSWNSGDSIMHQYAPYCSTVEPCKSLSDMERVLGRLLKLAT